MAEFGYPIRATSLEALDKRQTKALENYFALRKNGGGYCEVTHLTPTESRIAFAKREVQERVLQKRVREIKSEGEIFTVVIRKEEPTEPVPDAVPDFPSNSAHSQMPIGSPSGAEKMEGCRFQLDLAFHRHLLEDKEARLGLHQRLQNLSCHHSILEEKDGTGQILVFRAHSDSAALIQEWESQVKRVLDAVTEEYFSKRAMDVEEQVTSSSPTETLITMNMDRLLQALPLSPTQIGAMPSVIDSDCKVDSSKYCIIQEPFENKITILFPNLAFSLTEEDLCTKLHLKGTPEEVCRSREILKDYLATVTEYHFDLPKVMQFLSFWHPLELSEMLFSQLPGKVTLEVTDDVALFGDSISPLKEARKLLEDTILEEIIDIPESDQPATLAPAWKDLLTSTRIEMDKKLKVCTQGTPNQGCRRVTLVGFKEEVGKAKQTLLHYLSKEAIIHEEVNLKSVHIAQYFMELLEVLGVEKLKADAKIQLTPSPAILLSGTKKDVAQSNTVIEAVLKTVTHEILTVPRVGSYEYFSGEGAILLQVIGRENKCLIKRITSPSDADTSVGTPKNSQEENMVIDTFRIPGRFVVFVYWGDITKQRVDAIVNAANEDLKHSGGVAAAISQAGGPDIQKESKDWVRSHGKVLPGQAVSTSAGKLPCKMVIHAVGPRGPGAKNQTWELQESASFLKSAITRSLHLAEREHLTSIAIPCLSSGAFGVPIVLCVEWIVDAVKSFTEQYARADHSLREVILIDVKREVVSELQTACTKVWGGFVSASHEINLAGDAERRQTTTPSAVKVTYHLGNIENWKADVIVVYVLGKNFDLTSTRVGTSLLKKAGDGFKVLYASLMKGKKLVAGDVLEVDVSSGSYHLACRTVLILGCSVWDGESGAAAQALCSGVANCLRRSQVLGASTVAMPVIGPGLALGFPNESAARIFFQEVQRFGMSQPWRAEIQLVIHQSAPYLREVFQEAEQDVESGDVPATRMREGGALYHSLHQSETGIQIRVGKFTVHAKKGDILMETTDAIVNPTNLKSPMSGAVSNAIFTKARLSIAEEVQKAKISAHEIVVTSSGGLPCRRIMHISIQDNHDNRQSVKQSVKNVMKKCQAMNYASVAFPAFGTGQGKMDPQISAAAMIDGIAHVAQKEAPSSLTDVYLVLFCPMVYSAFKSELQNRLGQQREQTYRGAFKKRWRQLTSTGTNTAPEIFESTQALPLAMLDIMGGTKVNVEMAKIQIEQVVQRNWKDIDFQDPQIANLEKQHVKQILAVGKDSGVHITIEKGLVNRIRLQGYDKTVLKVQVEIQNILKDLLQRRCEYIQQESVSLRLEWMYRLMDTYVPFDATANHKLEEHFAQFGRTGAGVTVYLDGSEAMVNFDKMEATLRNTGKVARVKRREIGSECDLPVEWDDMNALPLLLVVLDPNCQEYQGVRDSFLRTTTGLQIVKIQRIQNTHLRLAYEVKKKAIAKKNGQGGVNEKTLFHGTAYQNSSSINRHGFNRSYDANAKAYGDGVYFAVEARYSSHPRYSPADSLTGLRCMYQAKVVTGIFTEGKKGMRVPPARPGCSPNDLYDSVVNKMDNPEMFVVFHDDQAYPEYLITFK